MTNQLDESPALVRPLDQGWLEELGRVKGQPFVWIRLSNGDGAPSVASFDAEPDQARFVEEVGRFDAARPSRLLRALEQAARKETYDSADSFFSWAVSSEPAFETIFLGLPRWTLCPAYRGYPLLAVDAGRPARAAGEDRAEILLSLFEAWWPDASDNEARMDIVEALALGLSRLLGRRREPARALKVVEKVLSRRTHSIHLRAAKHALRLLADDKPVPPRLAKFVGDDNGYLKRFVCLEPFKRFDIGPTGDVLVCCGHWLPTSIGNFMRSETSEIMNSAEAKAIRKSVTDGTFKYCNHLDCTALIQEYLPSREQVNDPVIREAIEKEEFSVPHIDRLMFAFDRTCNLSCPSCRRDKIVEKESESEEKARAVADKLLPLLPKLQVLDINPAGEFLASKPSRRLLELVNQDSCPYLLIHIISNGTLFSEEEWNKFPGIHGKVGAIRVSTDAASKDTFEVLRRGGNWERFMANLQFLSRLRRQNGFNHLKISFTYQLRNFREMVEFVELGLSLNCDFILFERLQNMGAFTDAEYRAKAVHLPDHPLHKDFLEIVRHPIFRNPRVWHDFDFEGVDVLSRDVVRRRAIVSGGSAKAQEHMAEGRQHEAAGNRGLALASYKYAAALEPNWLEPYLALGNVLSVLGGIGDAVDSFKKALDLKPDLVDAHLRLAVLFVAQHRFAASHGACNCGADLERSAGKRHADDWRETYFSTFRDMRDRGASGAGSPEEIWGPAAALAEQGRYDDVVKHYRDTSCFWDRHG